MQKIPSVPVTPFVIDIGDMTERMKRFDLRIATPQELRDGIEITERLIGSNLAPIAVIEAIQVSTQVSTWVTGSPVEGFFLIIPLTESGIAALRDGSFTPPSPSTNHICPSGDPTHGVYVGVYAGETHEARRNVMTSAATLRVELFGSVPCFARGATEDGARSMISLGFVPLSGGLPDLFVQEAIAGPHSQAA